MIALEKSVLLKYSERSLTVVAIIFFDGFKGHGVSEAAKILRPKGKFVNLFRNVNLLFFY
jgi:hypothetical protein